jgi:hypothetical protein
MKISGDIISININIEGEISSEVDASIMAAVINILNSQLSVGGGGGDERAATKSGLGMDQLVDQLKKLQAQKK